MKKKSKIPENESAEDIGIEKKDNRKGMKLYA